MVYGFDRLSKFDCQCRAAQAVGVRSDKRCNCTLANPGSTAARYSRTGSLIRRQVSMIERIAAIFGPACGSPTWIQFLRPTAIGRMEFSAKLVLSSNSG